MLKTILLSLFIQNLLLQNVICVDENLESYINSSDIELLEKYDESTTESQSKGAENTETSTNIHDQYLKEILEQENNKADSEEVDCFGFGNVTRKMSWILNLKPKSTNEILTDFYFSSRKQRQKVQVINGKELILKWVYYDPKIPTIIIVHGFMSYGGASWVTNMTNAFLDWKDVNVITVDWSRGGRTWKYWRAVANTRTVGTELADFLGRLIDQTKANTKDFHFLGHSLGAHICSYAAVKLKGVGRITGLDPAQPCFKTTDMNMLLDKSDADFVDVIHTNGRNMSKLGLGVQRAFGHQDFYPNGGMKQPGCHNKSLSFFSRINPLSAARFKRAKCNHGRSHLLFTESLKKNNCTLIGHSWNMAYSSVNVTIATPCTEGTCAELGINAINSPARGTFYVITTSEKPYCDSKAIDPEMDLLSDIKLTQIYSAVSYSQSSTAKYEPYFRLIMFMLFGIFVFYFN